LGAKSVYELAGQIEAACIAGEMDRAIHLTARLTFAEPGWSLEEAAVAMVHGGFRHLVVVDGADLVGILSMRDIVRVWSGEGASCDVPSSPR